MSPTRRDSSAKYRTNLAKLPLHPSSTAFKTRSVTDSIEITWKQRDSTVFNKGWNLVPDQGVGGSNPLSPTDLFKRINSTSVFRLVKSQNSPPRSDSDA